MQITTMLSNINLRAYEMSRRGVGFAHNRCSPTHRRVRTTPKFELSMRRLSSTTRL